MKRLKLPLPPALALASPQARKTAIVLAAALGMGLLAALGARSYLSNQMAQIEALGKGRMVEVVVAKFDLPKGQRLSSDNLAVRSVLGDQVHSLALRPEQFERVEGKALAFEARGGEPILWAMVEGSRAPTFSARVATGQRAMTVAVDEINSISGLLEPGDLIDLVVTLDQKGRQATFVLLQGVAVLATGQRSVDDPKSGERRLYSTVTLDTDPQQARNIIVAREAGKLTALLRNPQDKARQPGAEPDLAAWLSGTGRAVAVPVLYGGRGGQLPPEGLQLNQRSAADAALDAMAMPTAAAANEPDGEAAPRPALLIGGPATRPAP